MQSPDKEVSLIFQTSEHIVVEEWGRRNVSHTRTQRDSTQTHPAAATITKNNKHGHVSLTCKHWMKVGQALLIVIAAISNAKHRTPGPTLTFQ